MVSDVPDLSWWNLSLTLGTRSIPPLLPELIAAVVAILAVMAEALHARRVARVAHLAFGPRRRPAAWAVAAPVFRTLALAALAWGFATLILEPPRIHGQTELPDRQKRHILLLLDVSPSMRLKDAGPKSDQTRRRRAAELMESFFERVPISQALVSIVAFYNGAKPVVVDTRDLEVVRNILNDLPLEQAFPTGRTTLFDALEEAAAIAKPWNPGSALILIVTDGDTVPAQGMPVLPASVRDVVIVGVGDPRAGSFIGGRQSRQDASTLRSLAVRLNGTYHDGNAKQIPTALLAQVTGVESQGVLDQLTRREYALIALGAGGFTLAGLPWLLHRFGTRWRPGVPSPGRPAHRPPSEKA